MFKNLFAKLRSRSGQVVLSTPGQGSQSGAKDSSDSQAQDEKLNGLIGDIDLSDVPEEDRARVKSLLAQKVKNYDAMVTRKSQELSSAQKELKDKEYRIRDLERLSEEVEGNPELKDAFTKMVNDFRAGRSVSQQKISESQELLDQLISSSADAETKEQLRQLGKIIEQKSGTKELRDQIASLKQELSGLKQMTSIGLTQSIETNLTSLKEKYGEELVDKYEGNIRQMAAKYPHYSSPKEFFRLLHNFASEDEIETSLLKSAQKKKEVAVKRKQDGVFPGGESVVSTKVEKPKDKFGRTDMRAWVQKLKNAGRFDKR